MGDEKQSKPVFKVERTWSINVNDDIYVEPSDIDHDSIRFISSVEDDEVLFSLSFESFEELYKTVAAERERQKKFEGDGKK